MYGATFLYIQHLRDTRSSQQVSPKSNPTVEGSHWLASRSIETQAIKIEFSDALALELKFCCD
ncbi:hypothetical protein E2C01_043478 [Portunus trituberculatus]|uniref:Uncharacterized protein n=1 Tax=Portunus trituberculatus TaxID=210409 RepID=A0A5B7FXP1_PORTR|nr:hypothetical protein [Portunus trituberculatus]